MLNSKINELLIAYCKKRIAEVKGGNTGYYQRIIDRLLKK